MRLKKLIPDLVAGLDDAGFLENPTAAQIASMPQIKSGADLFLIGPEGTGKTTAIVMGVIQRLKQPFEDAPRAIIMVATKEKAFEVEEMFKKLGRYADLRTFSVFDQGVVQYQKDVIFEGLDVLIGTPKQLNELARVNGIRFTSNQMFVVDDLQTYRSDRYTPIYQIADSTDKSQFILVADAWSKNFEKLTERIMKNPRKVVVE